MRPCPRSYLHTQAQLKQSPFPPPGFHRLLRYYELLGLPPGTSSLHLRLIDDAAPNVGHRVGPLLFPIQPSVHALLRTPEVSSVLFRIPDAVFCLRRDMIGSATSPFGFYVTRLQGSLYPGPARLLPSVSASADPRAFDAPLRLQDLSRNPGPATRFPGGYRGGTFTRWLDRTFRTHHW